MGYTSLNDKEVFFSSQDCWRVTNLRSFPSWYLPFHPCEDRIYKSVHPHEMCTDTVSYCLTKYAHACMCLGLSGCIATVGVFRCFAAPRRFLGSSPQPLGLLCFSGRTVTYVVILLSHSFWLCISVLKKASSLETTAFFVRLLSHPAAFPFSLVRVPLFL